jgi:hypothetical protein
VTLNSAKNSPCSCHQVLDERDVQEALEHQVDQELLVLHQFPEDHEDPGKTNQWKFKPTAKYVLVKTKSTNFLLAMTIFLQMSNNITTYSNFISYIET